MLTESFIAAFGSVANSTRTPAALKDAGACEHAWQPVAALAGTFRRSASDRNGLAVSDTHVFTAQAGKAVLHVYGRGRRNQEATVPLHERVHSIALAGGGAGAALAIGTEGGRLVIWETSTGRQTTTAAAHLHPVASLVADSTRDFLLSGSADSNISVWSLSGLTSFSKHTSQNEPTNTPLRTFTQHRAPITAIATGHSISRNNIAVSVSTDHVAIVWEYQSGKPLHTYLLPASPISLAIDPADRAFYIGYEDGSVQLVDFYHPPSFTHPLYDPSQQPTPTQLAAKDRWEPPPPNTQDATVGSALCLTLSYDSTVLLSGHGGGQIVRWDICRRRFAGVVTHIGVPVTNLHMLVPASSGGSVLGSMLGLRPERGSTSGSLAPTVAVRNVVRPRVETALAAVGSGQVPAAYAVHAQITHSAALAGNGDDDDDDEGNFEDDFSRALSHPSFPPEMLAQGLAELAGLAAEGVPARPAGKQQSFSVTGASGASDMPEADDSVSVNGAAPNTTITATPANTAGHVQSLESDLAAVRHQLMTQTAARNTTLAELAALRKRVRALEGKGRKGGNPRARNTKEARALSRRKAWFAAEKRGESGDRAVRRMEEEEKERNQGGEEGGDDSSDGNSDGSSEY